MRGSWGTAAVVAAAMLVAGATGGARADGAAAWEHEDVCGDASAQARSGDTTVGSPDPVSPAFDLRAAAMRVVHDEDGNVLGIDLELRTCAPLITPEATQSYGFAWDRSGCFEALELKRAALVDTTGMPGPVGVFLERSCLDREVLGTFGTMRLEYRVEVPDARVRVAGDTLAVALRRGELGPAEPAVSPGATWTAPRAATRGTFVSSDAAVVGFGPPRTEAWIAPVSDVATGRDLTVAARPPD